MKFLLLIIAACACPGAALAQCRAPWWSSLSPVPGVRGQVRVCTEWDPDGPGPSPSLLIVGGQFTAAGNVPVQNVAAWDGARWTAMGSPPPSAIITCLYIHDGVPFAGFSYPAPGGIAVARWDGAAWQPVGTLGGSCDSIAGSNGSIVAVGSFFGVPRAVFWNGHSWINFGSPLGGAEFSLIDHAGILYLRGNFSSHNGQPANGLLDFNGIDWRPTSTPAHVRSAVVHAGTLYVWAQDFLNNHEAVYYRQGPYWTFYALPPAIGGHSALSAADNQLFFCGGDPSNVELRTPGVAVSTETGQWQPMGVDSQGIHGVTTFRNTLIAFGSMTTADDHAAAGLAQWDGSRWQPLSPGLSGDVHALTIHRGEPIAAGVLAGADSAGVLRWDGSNWSRIIPLDLIGPSPSAWNPLPIGIASFEDQLFISGRFTVPGRTLRWPLRWDGVTLHEGPFHLATPVVVDNELYALVVYDNGYGVERWTGSGWEPIGERLSNVPHAITRHDGVLVVGGRFRTSDSQPPLPLNYVAQLIDGSWQPLGDGLPGSGYTGLERVTALASFQGRLIAAGQFPVNSPVGSAHFASWDGQAWSPLTGGPAGYAEHMLLHRGELFVGGISRVQAWNGTSTRSIGLGGSAWTADLAAWNGDILVGGSFPSVNALTANNVAVLHHAGVADFDADGSPGTDEDIRTFFAALAGDRCPTCGNADFNNDGDSATDADIEAFFRVLAGQPC